MIYRFDDFELDIARCELRRRGQSVALEKRVFDLLAYLVQHSDRVVTKSEIFGHVWEGRVVSPGSLTVAMSALRRALGDDAVRQVFIRTHSGRGYRFIKPVYSTQVSLKSPSSSFQKFIGRTQHIASFLRLIDSPSEHSSTLLICGEPGIGKSRLLSEYALLSSARGIKCCLVSCPETERTPYLWPCEQIVRKLTGDHGKELANLLPPHLAAPLSPLFPEVFTATGVRTPSDPDGAQFQLFEALAALFRELVTDDRTVILLDDLHRADAGTARLLPFLLRELRDTPITFVATFRLPEAQRSDILAHALASLEREPRAFSLPLAGLNADETFALANTLSSSPLSDSLRAELHARTGGNPFFVHQLVPLLEGSTSWSWNVIPPVLSEAIVARISGLSLPTRELLSRAAVVGRQFQPEACPLFPSRSDIEPSLREAAAAGLLSISADPSAPISFVHVLVRDVLYSLAPIHERRAYHLQIARSLDSASTEFSERQAADASFHYVKSGDRSVSERAIFLAQAAATIATQRCAHEDAAHHYRLALEALALSSHQDPQRKCTLLLSLGEALCRSGDREAAKSTFREAALLAQRLGSSHELARAALGVAPGVLAAEAGVSDPSLDQLLREALAMLDDSATELRALLAARLAMSLQWSESESSHRAMGDALSLLEQVSNPAVRARVMFADWFCSWHSTTISRRHALADEIADLADEASDDEMLLLGLVLRMVGMLERGQIGQFDAALARFDALARSMRQPQSLWYVPMYKGMRALVDGRLDDAAIHQSEFTAVATRVNDANAFHSFVAQAALMHSERGNLECMLDTLLQGTRRYPNLRGFRAGLAWAFLNLGRLKEAAHELATLAMGSFADVPQRYDWPSTMFFAAEVCSALGDQRRAKSLYELLAPYQGYAPVVGLGVAHLGSADRTLGLLAETLGQLERAEWHFQRALEMTSAGMPVWNAHTKVDYARFQMRFRRARSGQALQLASEALQFARAMKLKRLEERASSILAKR